MFHIRHIKVNVSQNQKRTLHQFYVTAGLGPPDIKEQLRRGVILATVSSVLLLVGSILTWLVFREVFGSKVPIMGPLVMALGILLLVLAIRQFFIVWKHKCNTPAEKKADNGNAGEGGGEEGDVDAVEMDTWDTDAYKTSDTAYSGYQSQCSNPLNPEDQDAPSQTIPTPMYLDVAALVVNLPNQPQTTHIPHIVKQYSNPKQPTTTHLNTLSAKSILPPRVDKVRSCSDLIGMAPTSQAERPNPRPVVRYSQGQLEMLDLQVAAAGASRMLMSAIGNAPQPPLCRGVQ